MRPLVHECDVFTRYLVGQLPNDYVRSKYEEFHAAPDAGACESVGAFDRLLVDVARWHPWLTKVADAYARLFAPRGLLRKKLILTLAILESCAPFHRRTDAVLRCGRPVLLAWLAVVLAASALTLFTAVVLFLPCQLGCSLLAKLRREPWPVVEAKPVVDAWELQAAHGAMGQPKQVAEALRSPIG